MRGRPRKNGATGADRAPGGQLVDRVELAGRALAGAADDVGQGCGEAETDRFEVTEPVRLQLAEPHGTNPDHS